jgi:hypothetical protein
MQRLSDFLVIKLDLLNLPVVVVCIRWLELEAESVMSLHHRHHHDVNSTR